MCVCMSVCVCARVFVYAVTLFKITHYICVATYLYVFYSLLPPLHSSNHSVFLPSPSLPLLVSFSPCLSSCLSLCQMLAMAPSQEKRLQHYCPASVFIQVLLLRGYKFDALSLPRVSFQSKVSLSRRRRKTFGLDNCA